MSALQAVDAVVQLAQRTYEQGELIADIATGIVDSHGLDANEGRRVQITLHVTPEVARRLQDATGVLIRR